LAHLTLPPVSCQKTASYFAIGETLARESFEATVLLTRAALSHFEKRLGQALGEDPDR